MAIKTVELKIKGADFEKYLRSLIMESENPEVEHGIHSNVFASETDDGYTYVEVTDSDMVHKLMEGFQGEATVENISEV